ncbi:MAG: signal peptidase I [Candidatus Methanomethylicus sp.]|nr:signal peptidase I [Candidatus Methanomethylicus sp.]
MVNNKESAACLLVVVAIIAIALFVPQARVISYVTSSSMEPTMHVGDVFFITPKALSGTPAINDIIVFQYPLGSSHYLVHRVVGLTPTGFITRGDNSPFTDQQGGFPQITMDSLMGKVVTISGRPFTIPIVGLGINYISKFVSNNFLLVMFGVISAIGIVLSKERHKLKIKKVRSFGIKTKYVYLLLLIVMLAGTTLMTLYKTEDLKVNYLSTRYVTKFTAPNNVFPGSVMDYSIDIENNGLVPNYVTFKPSSGNIQLQERAMTIWPGEIRDVQISIQTSKEIGWHGEGIQVSYYVQLLPSSWIAPLIALSPYSITVLTDAIVLGIFLAIYKKLDEKNAFIGLKRFQILSIRRRFRGIFS